MIKLFILGTLLTVLGLSLFDWLQKDGDVFDIYNPPKKWRFRSLQWFCYFVVFILVIMGVIALNVFAFRILQNLLIG